MLGVGPLQHSSVPSVEMLTDVGWLGLCAAGGSCPGRVQMGGGGGGGSKLPPAGGRTRTRLPQVPLLCESEELVSLCFLKPHLSRVHPGATPGGGGAAALQVQG